MFILDLIAGLLGGTVPGRLRAGPQRRLSPGESWAYGVGTVVLPLIGFIVVLFWLWRKPMVAVALLPIVFTMLAGLLSARLGNEGSWTLRVVLLTAISVWISCAVALFLGALAGFYSDF